MVALQEEIITQSKGDRYENLSPKEYLNVTKRYLRDLINEHRPIMELNNNNNKNNNNNSNNNIDNNNDNNSNNNNIHETRKNWVDVQEEIV